MTARNKPARYAKGCPERQILAATVRGPDTPAVCTPADYRIALGAIELAAERRGWPSIEAAENDLRYACIGFLRHSRSRCTVRAGLAILHGALLAEVYGYENAERFAAAQAIGDRLKQAKHQRGRLIKCASCNRRLPFADTERVKPGSNKAPARVCHKCAELIRAIKQPESQRRKRWAYW